jgi:hypothetical protein
MRGQARALDLMEKKNFGVIHEVPKANQDVPSLASVPMANYAQVTGRIW